MYDKHYVFQKHYSTYKISNFFNIIFTKRSTQTSYNIYIIILYNKFNYSSWPNSKRVFYDFCDFTHFVYRQRKNGGIIIYVITKNDLIFLEKYSNNEILFSVISLILSFFYRFFYSFWHKFFDK